MKNVYYIGYYNGLKCKKRKNCAENHAATVKMNFIIDSLKMLGYHVSLISLSIGCDAGFMPAEHVWVDDREEHYYIPYFAVRVGGKVRLGGRTALAFLKRYVMRYIKKDDIVITYHSLAYGSLWNKLHRRIGFKWISQVDEIYCLSRKDYENPKYLAKEIKMFSGGDGFLFVNDNMAQKYAGGKPFAISYGNYNVYAEREIYCGEKIGIVYTGIINQDRGAFKIIDAMRYLPEKYELHILGFGTDANMAQMKQLIDDVNKEGKKVFFEGTRSGQEYTNFLLENQIGVSLMDIDEKVADNAFPSKILAYLGHSLFVVSSKCSCVLNSKIADILYFCDETAEDVAKAILSIPVYTKNRSADKLREIKRQFLVDLQNVLQANN